MSEILAVLTAITVVLLAIAWSFGVVFPVSFLAFAIITIMVAIFRLGYLSYQHVGEDAV